MHPKVLPTDGWRLVRRLSSAGIVRGWTLAGGTGLALQLGHRISEDLDFFRPASFDVGALVRELTAVGPVAVQDRSRGSLHAVVGGLRLSFLEAEAPLLFPATPYRGLELADPRDIAIMKLVEIGGRGSRKDFVDLYCYLASGGELEELLTLLARRFKGIDYNEYHLLKSLVYFEDADDEPMPRLLVRVSWDEVKAFLESEASRLSP